MGNFSLNCCTSDIFSPGNPETTEIQKNRENIREANLVNKERSPTMGVMNSSVLRGRNTECSRPTTQFIMDDHEVAVNILLSTNYYNLLNQSNDEEELLKPLEHFTGKNLILIIYQIYNITTSLIVTVQTKRTFEYYDETLTPIFSKEINFDEEISEIPNLMKIISNITELYHYFKYWLSGQKGVYVINYWEKIQNKEEYFAEKINLIQSLMDKIQSQYDE